MIKKLIPLIFSQKFFQKIFAIFLLVLIFYAFRGFLGLFLITFIFAYLSLEVAEYLHIKIAEQSKISQNSIWKKLKKILTVNNIVTILYIIFIIVLCWLVISIFPKIAFEIERFIQHVPRLAGQLEDLMMNLENTTGMDF